MIWSKIRSCIWEPDTFESMHFVLDYSVAIKLMHILWALLQSFVYGYNSVTDSFCPGFFELNTLVELRSKKINIIFSGCILNRSVDALVSFLCVHVDVIICWLTFTELATKQATMIVFFIRFLRERTLIKTDSNELHVVPDQ